MKLESNGLTGDTAIFSADELHRYELRRRITEPAFTHPETGARADVRLVSIGLNPSTADAFTDDATVRKEMGFAKRWGCSLYIKLNTESFRTKDPAILKRQRKLYASRGGGGEAVPVPTWDESTDGVIRAVFAEVRPLDTVLMACGAHALPERMKTIAVMAEERTIELVCLGTNQDGSPVHTLYQPYDLPRRAWRAP
jgi:hypothetical protein